MNLIKNIFNTTNEVDNTPYRKLLGNFFFLNKWKWKFTISNVTAYDSNKKVTLVIETTKPGLLVGKNGHFISRLKVYLEDKLDKEVELKIKENKIWCFN